MFVDSYEADSTVHAVYLPVRYQWPPLAGVGPVTDRTDQSVRIVDEQIQQLLERVAADDAGRFDEAHSPCDCPNCQSHAVGESTETAANGVPMIVEHDAAETTVRGPDPLAFEQAQAADARIEADD